MHRVVTNRRLAHRTALALSSFWLVLVASLIAEPRAQGVPISTGTALWLDGNDVDGDGVAEAAGETTSVLGATTWVDKAAGMTVTNAAQPVAGAQPAFVPVAANLNNRSAFNFDSVNDVLEVTSAAFDLQTSDITVFTAAISETRPGNPALIDIGRGGSSTFTFEHNQGTLRFAVWDETAAAPSLTTTNTYTKNPTPHIGFVDKRVNSPLATNNGRLRISADGDALASVNRDLTGHVGTGAYIGWFGGNEFWKNNIGEVIVYDRLLDTPERVIVQNYLSAKWNIPLNANNRYSGDTIADYDDGVFGIGEEDATTVSTGTYGQGLTLSESGGSLSEGEYVLAGHRVTVNSLIVEPSISGTRWDRVWYLDKTGTVDTLLEFDWSEAGLAAPTLGFFQRPTLLFAPNSSLVFTPLLGNPTISGDEYSFLVPNSMLQNGFYTLGIITVPEPSSLVLVSLGGLALARRVRRRQRTD